MCMRTGFISLFVLICVACLDFAGEAHQRPEHGRTRNNDHVIAPGSCSPARATPNEVPEPLAESHTECKRYPRRFP